MVVDLTVLADFGRLNLVPIDPWLILCSEILGVGLTSLFTSQHDYITTILLLYYYLYSGTGYIAHGKLSNRNHNE